MSWVFGRCLSPRLATTSGRAATPSRTTCSWASRSLPSAPRRSLRPCMFVSRRSASPSTST
eukprot:4099616-Alexandrium_andersonii.AAC.1